MTGNPNRLPHETAPAYDVVAFGARDYYQVAAALHGVGRLGRIVTDFYAPDRLRSALGQRFHEDISSRHSFSIYPTAAILGLYNKLGITGRFWWDIADWLLGFSAGAASFLGRRRAVVYSYNLIGFVSFYRFLGRRPEGLVCFQVHPTAWYCRKSIMTDAERFAPIHDVAFQPDADLGRAEGDPARYLAALRQCDRIICASNVTRQSLEFLDHALPPISIVAYGSKLEHEKKQPASAAPKIRLLSVCQVVQRKGLHWAFEAMSRLEPELRARFEWTVVASKVDPEILRLAPDNLVLRGRLPDAELSALMGAADLFVLPSVIEGFGLVYIEALSLGTPIVYTRATGVGDFCVSGTHGFEVPVSSGDELERIFRGIAADPSLVRAMRPACLALAADFSWERFRAGIRRALFEPAEPPSGQADDVSEALAEGDQR